MGTFSIGQPHIYSDSHRCTIIEHVHLPNSCNLIDRVSSDPNVCTSNDQPFSNDILTLRALYGHIGISKWLLLTVFLISFFCFCLCAFYIIRISRNTVCAKLFRKTTPRTKCTTQKKQTELKNEKHKPHWNIRWTQEGFSYCCSVV